MRVRESPELKAKSQRPRAKNQKLKTKDQKSSVAIVGYGRVGRVFARAFVQRDYRLQGIVTRRPPEDLWLAAAGIVAVRKLRDLPDDIDFLLLCVRDGELAGLADGIVRRGGFRDGTMIAHTAGAVSAAVLEAVRGVGGLPLACHPLQTFTGDEGPELLEGITFGMDGDPAAVKAGGRIARDLGGTPFRVPPELRPLYHLGGVFACNLMAALAAISQDLL